MALPELLLVDDSEVILAYERAALSDHYAITTACDGVEALARLRRQVPDAVLLDLSMPRMNGEELLAILRDDDVLRSVPVILVSSEVGRAQHLLAQKLVAAFVAKPVQAQELQVAVERVLEAERWQRSRAGLAVLRVDVGPLTVALPLSRVSAVVAQPRCLRVTGGPAWLTELLRWRGQIVPVIDLAARLGVPARAPYVDRFLILTDIAGTPAALAVDDADDPEVAAADDVAPLASPLPPAFASLPGLVTASIRVASALVPVLDIDALVPEALRRSLPIAVASTGWLTAAAALSSSSSSSSSSSRSSR